MAMHRVHLDAALPEPGESAAILGDEAQHAVRVKRLEVGHTIELLDGRGRIARADITAIEKLGKKGGWSLTARIVESREVPRVTPAIHVRSAPPKGPRLEHMIDQLAQVGAASWGPLVTHRTVVDPREGKLARLERVAAEASKQSGRAWTLEIAPGLRFADAVDAGGDMLLADASGEPVAAGPITSPSITLLIGPEGGWEDRELSRAREAGVRIARFGPHVMRIETAAVVAAGALASAAVTSPGAGPPVP